MVEVPWTSFDESTGARGARGDSTLHELASHLRQIDLADCDDDAVEFAKTAFLDLLAVAVGSNRSDISTFARRVAAAQFGSGDSTIWGSILRTSPTGAAYANASAANALDLEDGARDLAGHPGSVVVPAALAVAESVGSRGAELLQALIVGYEAAILVGGSRRPFPDDRWPHGWESYGPAAAAARLLGLEVETFGQALALAGFQGPNQPAGLATRAGTLVKSPCPGWASATGTAAAYMAEAGFTAPPDILDDPRFYDPLHIDGTGPLKILKLYFKEHASCRWTHPAIEGALECLTKLGGSPNQVEEVVIQTFAVARLLDNTRPQSAVQAQFSIPYTVAAAIVFGEMGAAQQDQTCFEDALVQKIADAVQIELDPAHDSVFPDQTEATVTVRLNDGSSASTTIEFPRGDPQRPLEPEVLKRRARGLLDPVLGPTQTSALMDTVNQLEHCDATDVTSLLQVSA